MENTLENKSMFFTQYWGQHIIKYKGAPDMLSKINEWSLPIASSDSYVELKPVSLITPKEQGFVISSNLSNDEDLVCPNKIGNYFRGDVFITDYLRSKGYALPYMGLSVETLVEYGWIKLTTV